MVLTSRLPSRSTTAYTFLARRLLTNTVPLSPSASERASGTPSTQTSTLNPAGTFSLSIGSPLAARPVICGANGCKVESDCSAGRPCCQGGAAAGVVGCAAGVADGAGCASAAAGAISPAQASADAIKKRRDTGDMECPPISCVCCPRRGAPMQLSGRNGIIATPGPDYNAARLSELVT